MKDDLPTKTLFEKLVVGASDEKLIELSDILDALVTESLHMRGDAAMGIVTGGLAALNTLFKAHLQNCHWEDGIPPEIRDDPKP